MNILKIITLNILSFTFTLNAANPERIAVFPFKASGIDTNISISFVELLRNEIGKSKRYEVFKHSEMKKKEYILDVTERFSGTFGELLGNIIPKFAEMVTSVEDNTTKAVTQKDRKEREQKLINRLEKLRKDKEKLNQSTKKKLDRQGGPSKSSDEVIASYEKLYSSCRGKKNERCADIMYRLSKLYYDKERYDYIKAMTAYKNAVNQLGKNPYGLEIIKPVPDYSKSLQFYQKSVKEYPDFIKSDEAYFRIGTILTLNGDLDGAKDAFEKLILTHPTSIRASAGHFRLSEFCFMDRDFTCALKHINKIDKKYVTPEVLEVAHYREAEIYYNRAEFDRAIDLFFSYVDKCDRGEYPKRDLRDEALEYLAISFSDVPNGAEKAIEYFNKHGHREYKHFVIYKVGMKNFNRGQYDQARLALKTALSKFPDYMEAPLAQQMIVSCFVVRKKYETANEEREKLVDTYKAGSEWAGRNESDSVALEKASIEVKKALASIPVYYHAEARKKKNKGMYESALMRYQQYIDLFPEEKWKVYEFKYNMAEICNSLRMYEKAAANYDYVATQDLKAYPRFKMELDTSGMDQEEIERKKIERRKSSPVAISQEEAGYNAIVALDNLRKEKMREQNLTEEQFFHLPETQKFINYITNFTTRFPKSSNSPEVMYLLGNVYFAAKKYDLAMVVFKKIIAKYSWTRFGNQALRMLANAQTAAGKYDEAMKNYKKVISTEKPNTAAHTEVIGLAGGALFKKATDLKKSGDHAKASTIYKSIFKNYPASTLGDKGWFEAGVSLEEGNKIEDAAKTFQELGTYFPKSRLREKAYARAAENYKKLENWEQAGLVFEKAALNIPKAEYAIPSLSSAAENYEKAKMFNKAGQMYENILTKYPTDKKTPLAVYNGGLLYEKGELYEKAIDMYLMLGEKYPGSGYAADGYFSIGLCYEKLKKTSLMAKYFQSYAEKFTADRSKQIDALVRASKAYIELNKYSDAKKSAELATTVYEKYKDKATIDPTAASKAYFALGEIHQIEFDNIRLKGKSEEQVQQQIKKKTEAREPFLKAYENVINLGVGEWTIRASYQIGKSLVDFAIAFENQTLFGKDQWTKKVFGFYDFNVYSGSKIKIISGLEKYYVKAMENFYWNVNTAWEQNIKTEWVDKSRDEFTRLAYKKGYLFEKIGQICKNAPVPRGLSNEGVTAYKDEMEKKYHEALYAAQPKYEEGFYSAKELGITGSKWIDSIKSRVAFINPSSKILSETITERALKTLEDANATPTPNSNTSQTSDELGLQESEITSNENLILSYEIHVDKKKEKQSGSVSFSTASRYIPKQCKEYPRIFLRPLQLVDITKTREVVRGKPWIVYSDRNKNMTTVKPGGKTALYELSFLNRFYVAAENRKRDSIMIVKDPEIEGLNFSKNARSYGWISKNDMLLWHNCLVSPRGDSNKKAMIINKVDFIKSKDMPKHKTDISTFCKDPELKYKTEKKSRKIQIHFVYKYDEKNESLLLGTDSKMTGSHPWETIIGWVPKNRVSFWDTRLCIEPNWDPRAAIERQREQKKAIIFENHGSAYSYQRGERIDQESVFWDNDPFGTRNKGNWLRFPMLASIQNGTVLYVGAIGNTVDEEGEELQLYREAYTPYKIKDMRYPLYKYVLFLTQHDFRDLVTIMGDLDMATKNKDPRMGLYNTWINHLTIYTGNTKKNMIKEYTLEKAHKKLFRIISNFDDFNLIKDVKLKDIVNSLVLNDRLFEIYVSYIRRKYEGLKRIFDRPDDEDVLRYGNTAFYWVEEDLLP